MAAAVRRPTAVSTRLAVTTFAAAFALAFAACTPRIPTTRCTTNGECGAGLFCVGGMCRAACAVDQDCVDPRRPETNLLRCVRDPASGQNTCVTPDAGVDAGDATHDATPDAPLDTPNPDAPTDSPGMDTDSPDAACAPPRRVCASDCVDPSTDARHCGSCGVACPRGGAHTHPRCAMGSCSLECDAGYYDVAGTCTPVAPPRQRTPSYASTVTSRRPTFRWDLPPGAIGATLEVCRDRTCSMGPIATADFTGLSGGPTSDLPPGVLFWRLRSRTSAGPAPTATPMRPMRVGARTAAISTHWGTLLDVDLDGFGDLAITTQAAAAMGPVRIFSGRATGLLSTTPTFSPLPTDSTGTLYFGYPAVPAGDVNGDGLADVAIAAGGTRMNAGAVYVYHGAGAGIPATATATLDSGTTGGSLGFDSLASADFDADGYTDLAAGAIAAVGDEGRVFVYRGSATGLMAPGDVLTPPAGLGTTPRFGTVAAAGDVNGDGFADLNGMGTQLSC